MESEPVASGTGAAAARVPGSRRVDPAAVAPDDLVGYREAEVSSVGGEGSTFAVFLPAVTGSDVPSEHDSRQTMNAF